MRKLIIYILILILISFLIPILFTNKSGIILKNLKIIPDKKYSKEESALL